MGASMTEESVQASSKNGSLFLRKVEFHLARKPTSYLPVSSSSDFKLETLTPTSATTSTSDPYTQYLASNFPLTAPKKSESSNFVDYGFGVEFNHRIPFKRIGAGLENLGNTCFLNSVLQCLTYTEPLVAYLQSGRHQTSCHIAGFCALCAIQKHVSRALQSSGRSLAPKDLVSNLRCISRSFRNARQEDAHEYMIQLLEAMHKCCLPSGVPTESPSAYEKSLVHKIFGGRLRSQVKCMQCSYCSNKFDPFLDLSLEIMKADSLYKALLHFTAAEQLDGGQRQYNCERCKKKVKALKQLTVHKAPYVLTIHLKRFGSHVTGQKIDKKVQFGPALDLKPFLSGPYDGDLKYTLYGVLVHAGWSTHSGHYYCFVRTSTGMWYSLDDNRVYQVSEKSVLNQKAYMLFYVRDKNNFSSKKPIDVTQKGSIFEATVQNNSFPAPENHCSGIQHDTILKCLRESGSGQNGSISKQSNGSNSHDIPVQQKGSIVVSSSKACPKEFVEHCDDIILSECLFHKEKTVVWKSDAQAATHTTTCTDGRPSGTQFMTAASADVNEEDKCYKSHLLASEAKLTGVDCLANIVDDANLVPQASKLDNIAAANVLSDQNNAVSMNIDRNKSSCQKLNSAPLVYHNLMSEKNDCNKASNQPTNDQIGRANAIAKVASGHFAKDKLKKKKKKKKLFMGKGASMHLSRNILYGTFLSLQKRKNLRRTKRQAVNAHLNSKEQCISADVGPHASDRLTSSSNGSYKHSHKRDRTSGSSKSDIISVLENLKNGTGILQKEIFERKIPEMQCQNNSCSLLSGEQLGAQKPEVSKACVNDEVHTSDINTLTANLCETRIGHWDGVDLPPGIPEWKGLDDFRIGHVGDEWDEEYDRGKRKKVRQSRIGFGGSNPFQEIALKKAKLKR